jgi:hypothetical protein
MFFMPIFQSCRLARAAFNLQERMGDSPILATVRIFHHHN